MINSNSFEETWDSNHWNIAFHIDSILERKYPKRAETAT